MKKIAFIVLINLLFYSTVMAGRVRAEQTAACTAAVLLWAVCEAGTIYNLYNWSNLVNENPEYYDSYKNQIDRIPDDNETAINEEAEYDNFTYEINLLEENIELLRLARVFTYGLVGAACSSEGGEDGDGGEDEDEGGFLDDIKDWLKGRVLE